ncbi:MAG: hypothetical protein M1837_003363 [Sclerophora amabilis]|nr:MAG: hypothetical protein M1837_003363 [Sclerophora amabilis]
MSPSLQPADAIIEDNGPSSSSGVDNPWNSNSRLSSWGEPPRNPSNSTLQSPFTEPFQYLISNEADATAHYRSSPRTTSCSSHHRLGHTAAAPSASVPNSSPLLASSSRDPLSSTPPPTAPQHARRPSQQPELSPTIHTSLFHTPPPDLPSRQTQQTPPHSPSPSPSPAPQSSGFVDLTSTSPLEHMPNPTTNKRRRSSLSDPSSSEKRRKLSPPGSPTGQSPETIEQVDLQDVDDDEDLSALLKKQREEQVKSQQKHDERPTRISSIQCIICLEPPKNLTSTNCGMLPNRSSVFNR